MTVHRDSIGGALGATCGAYLGPVIGWRGLFLIGLLPALLTLLIRARVPESPRWLVRRGRREEARASIAWALQVDPEKIELPATLPEAPRMPWRALFKYPRSVALVSLTGLSQTSGVGLALWAPTLLLLLLHTTAAEASFLMIWVGLSAFVGRVTCAFLSELMGRRWSGIFACFGAVCTLILAGAAPNAFIGTVSVFWLMLVAHAFFSGGSYSIIAPYLAEVWPAGLRASGMGLGYGVGNLGKIISPLGLALIVGGSDFIRPKASVDAIMPAMVFLAFWAALAALAFLFLGIETKGRSIEEIDAAMVRATREVRSPAR
jgi:MFS transporter, putative metabolite:H+ symporter